MDSAVASANAIVVRARADGAASSLWLNETVIATGDGGSGSLTGLTIGALRTLASYFIGRIAHVSIYHGAKLANAATVAAAARQYYGI